MFEPLERQASSTHGTGATRSRQHQARRQAKLLIGAVDDPLEAQADRVAEQMAEQVLHRVPEGGRKDEGQTAAPRAAAGTADSADAGTGSAGHPLDAKLRAWFEPRFGVDFSQVRVHADRRAATAAQSIGARAYAAGPNLVFGHGQYRPDTDAGRRLLAHELTHVIQQGHAAPAPRGAIAGAGTTVAPVAPVTPVARAASMIQRDTPSGATSPVGPLSITKRYDPVNASREEVVQALTEYLNKEWKLQGGRQLQATERVRTAVLTLFRQQPAAYATIEKDLAKDRLLGSPAEFAAKVGDRLPEFIARRDMLQLVDAKPPEGGGDPTLVDKAKKGLNEAVDQIGKPPPPDPEPNGPVEAPSTTPTMGSSPGQHLYSIPQQTWGDPPAHKTPKTSLPQAPLASDDRGVDKIVQSLADDALVPAALKGTPQADEVPDAKLLAQDLANRLAAAQAKKQSTVYLTIGMNLPAKESPEVFDRIEALVRQIAAVLPGGAKGVDEVIVKTAPARRGGPYLQRVVSLRRE